MSILGRMEVGRTVFPKVVPFDKEYDKSVEFFVAVEYTEEVSWIPMGKGHTDLFESRLESNL